MSKLSINTLVEEFKHNFYMYIPLTIILQSCLGSIAAMYILSKGTTLVVGIELTLCVTVSMLYNAALLAQLKSKLTFWLLVASLGINTLLLIINLI